LASSAGGGFRAFLPTAIRCRWEGGLALPMPDPLLSFQLLRGSLRRSWNCLHNSSAHGLCERPLRVVPRADLQRVDRPSALAPCPQVAVPVRVFVA
jgi:hypothetical protein